MKPLAALVGSFVLCMLLGVLRPNDWGMFFGVWRFLAVFIFGFIFGQIFRTSSSG
jgi:hypothetical protein